MSEEVSLEKLIERLRAKAAADKDERRLKRNEWRRKWRKTRMTPEQRRKDITRSYAGVYLRRDKLAKQDCSDCGSPQSEMHHPDYSKPLLVVWLCRQCHLQRHKVSREMEVV